MITCPNPSCGRVFATPIKTINLKDPGRPYPACPYCFARVGEPHVESHKSENQVESHKSENQVESHKSENQDEKRSAKEKQSKEKDKPQNCRNHLGYLSERENKQQIPDECIICTAILDCMLQKMNTT